MEVMYDEVDFIQLTTPGCNDIIVFEKNENADGSSGGITHIGFRLRDPKYITLMEEKVMKAGGTIMSKGEFVPGSPYIFFRAPDNYEVEVWYEMLKI